MKEIFLRLNEASIIDDGFRQFPSIARPAVDHIIPYFLYIFRKGKLSSKSGHLERVAEILIGLRLRHRSIFPFFFFTFVRFVSFSHRAKSLSTLALMYLFIIFCLDSSVFINLIFGERTVVVMVMSRLVKKNN